MLSLAEEGVPVIQARIAERLGRSAPSVSEMLDRLREDGYVTREGRRLSLTESGQALAEKVVRKHRLAERLLVDVIGLEWHKVHREAGRWEHVISDDVEARLVELLGDPATCPHGNPIPGSHSPAPSVPVRPLAEVDAGERVRLFRISEEVELNLGSLTLLDEGGFIPGRRGPGGRPRSRGQRGDDGRGRRRGHPGLARPLRPAVRRRRRDPAARGRRRLHRRRRRHGAGPGRRRDRRRPHLLGRRPVAGPGRRPGTEVRRLGGLLMPGPGELPRALAHDAAAQRGRRAAARALAARGRLAARGAADRRGRVLGHAARRRRAARQRGHHHLRAVPPSRAGGRTPCSTPASAPVHPGHLRRARRRAGEQLGGAAGRRLRGGRRHGRGRRSGSRWASGPTPPTPCRRRAARHRRRGARRATRCCRSTSPRRRPSARWCRSATA